MKKTKLTTYISEAGSLRTASDLTGIPLFTIMRHIDGFLIPTAGELLRYATYLRKSVKELLEPEE